MAFRSLQVQPCQIGQIREHRREADAFVVRDDRLLCFGSEDVYLSWSELLCVCLCVCVLSKGHAAPALYAAWTEVGLLSVDDLLTLRKLSSDLEGHPTPRLSFVDVATGSLGQGLSNAAGMAYVGKYIDKASYRVYCVVGDGEAAEGNIWEALAFASYYKVKPPLYSMTWMFTRNAVKHSGES
ncbi:transketolase [Paragonimus westermani]|uniref:Transketolase n=1 Tax=Paragonimus westermani TaxID=34504 RepID=A0A5J4N6S7_9TREM|nr:transketolase [Paragonimus westermani]